MKIIKSKFIIYLLRIIFWRLNAITIGKYMIMLPELANNQDLITHEAVHVKQFQEQPFTFWLRYIFSRNQRLKFECEAFATQALYRVTHQKADLQATINAFATDIKDCYFLFGKFSLEYIKAELMNAYRVARL